jgi:hypothetical protein
MLLNYFVSCVKRVLILLKIAGFTKILPRTDFVKVVRKLVTLKTCRIGKNKKDNNIKKQKKIAYIGDNKGASNQDVVEYTDEETSDSEK